MTDNDDRAPPEIQQAAAKVQNWLDSRKPTTQPRPETAAERFKRAREIDQSKMPAWKDPRTA
jgi:hypothetical protein